jgi:fumarylacetoacetase
MFRSRDATLQPNWLHVPIGYHGRSSSIDIGGGPSLLGATAGCYAPGGVRCPCSQVMINPANLKKGSKYSLTRLLNFKLEVAFVVSGCTNIECVGGSHGGGRCRGSTTFDRTMTTNEAWGRIFGYILTNNWSTCNVHRWECVPLGPFMSKNKDKWAAIWVRANRTHCLPLPPNPSGDSIIVVVLVRRI